MHAFYLTLNYTSYTDPATDLVPDDDGDAHRGFLAELAHAVAHWDDTLIGYRVVDAQPVRRRRIVVRFITSPELSQVAAIAAAQRYLYDEGGLSGEFVYGVERRYVARVETDLVVWATDPDDAQQQAADAHGVRSVVRVGRADA